MESSELRKSENLVLRRADRPRKTRARFLPFAALRVGMTAHFRAAQHGRRLIKVPLMDAGRSGFSFRQLWARRFDEGQIELVVKGIEHEFQAV